MALSLGRHTRGGDFEAKKEIRLEARMKSEQRVVRLRLVNDRWSNVYVTIGFVRPSSKRTEWRARVTTMIHHFGSSTIV